eukprot:1127205-Prymnesium_polylepis.1
MRETVAERVIEPACAAHASCPRVASALCLIEEQLDVRPRVNELWVKSRLASAQNASSAEHLVVREHAQVVKAYQFVCNIKQVHRAMPLALFRWQLTRVHATPPRVDLDLVAPFLVGRAKHPADTPVQVGSGHEVVHHCPEWICSRTAKAAGPHAKRHGSKGRSRKSGKLEACRDTSCIELPASQRERKKIVLGNEDNNARKRIGIQRQLLHGLRQ